MVVSPHRARAVLLSGFRCFLAPRTYWGNFNMKDHGAQRPKGLRRARVPPDLKHAPFAQIRDLWAYDLGDKLYVAVDRTAKGSGFHGRPDRFSKSVQLGRVEKTGDCRGSR